MHGLTTGALMGNVAGGLSVRMAKTGYRSIAPISFDVIRFLWTLQTEEALKFITVTMEPFK
jgi:hypothetical protein